MIRGRPCARIQRAAGRRPQPVTQSAVPVGRRAKSLSVGPTERSFVARSTTKLLRMTPARSAALLTFAVVAVAVAVAGGAATAVTAPDGSERPHHTLEVVLDPASGQLAVTDTVTVPPADSGEVHFLLNGALTVTASEPEATEVPLGDAARFLGINASALDLAEGAVKRYRVDLPPSGGTVRLEYEGPFDFGLADQKEEYTRGFRETLGIVSPEGLYLAGNGFWYPHLGQGLLEFDMQVTLPDGWHVISQGNGTSRDAGGTARWDSHGPMDEIYLVGGPLEVYREAAGAVEALVYLRGTDDALAARYLQATAQYLEMYRELIGPYPYGKFALVENFWETGYGMPSFTLLGPRVIRFPFILASSYPHEILHNWWGNSVFVDYETGNWCEGLTAYMADHLIKEQRGQGEEYRRDTLQKYRSYVRDGRDFPLTEFRSRHSAATEAVGYGKTLLGFHMLRQRLGDDLFRTWAAGFYRDQRGRQASFSDVRESLEAVSGEDLSRFFTDWVERAGAAALEVSVGGVRESPHGGWQVEGTLRQTQAESPYLLDVPVVVQTEGPPAVAVVRMEGAGAAFVVGTEAPPLALHVDPSFDIFRRLDPRETPASIGQIFGEPEILAVLPADPSEAEGYRALVEGWRSESHQPEILTDAEVPELPSDRAVWLLGRANALAQRLFASGSDYAVANSELAVGGETITLADHTVVLVRRHPQNLDKAIGWIFTDDPAALPGLGRKLPHYGKYSYLGFEGDEPTNDLKGQWAPTESPLRVDLRPETERGAPVAALALPPRKALAELPPVFSRKALMEHVSWLAAPEREGRGVGTEGLDAAGEYVAQQFQKFGLEPEGDDGTYFQSFTTTNTPSGEPGTLRNVVGVLPGTDPEWTGQSALLTAHYDHLGRGWPDVHSGDEGQIHPGADDNASGVAVLLELARTFAAAGPPRRTILFVAFSGEEAGMLGSRHYVEHPVRPLDQIMGVINLDTVGRLGDKKLSVLATGTASEWPHIFRGASYVTGVESRMIPDALESSDQKSFIDRGVPAVQVFTDPHPDYHRPGDTVEGVDGAGLVKVATFVKEGIGYLAEREEPLTDTIAAAAAGSSPSRPPRGPGGSGRRVSFGTMPDFAFSGPGVKVAGVTPGSPAEKAGVQEGDIIRRFAGQEVESLRGYSEILKGLEAGQTVTVVLDRDGEEQTLEAVLAVR